MRFSNRNTVTRFFIEEVFGYIIAVRCKRRLQIHNSQFCFIFNKSQDYTNLTIKKQKSPKKQHITAI